jgi:phospholipase/lecithinase/hemolysin
MKPYLTRIAAASVALLGSLLVAGCGGGATADTTPTIKISAVKVFGDSIQDSGTFGYKFTVQSADNLIYAERVAANYGQTLCNFFVFTGTTFAANTAKTGCTNYSIGGGRITYTGAGGAANPLNVGTQMATYAAAGSYTASDLVIIDGGGNDAADLVGAYLTIPKDAAKTYSALLGTLLTPAQIGAALQGGAATTAQIGATYMTALADKFAAQIKASVLDKGATHVVLMNMPDVSYTPRFQMVLDSIAAASGGGAAGAAARAQSQTVFQGWMTAFNTQLASKFAGNDSVIVIDFYKAFQDQVATPAQFGLSNVKTPACPIKGVGSDGLPTYDFPTCTATALSAAPPAGVSGGADWWKSYAFSDSFHPTPYGHQLTQQLIGKALATKGWL